jgi:hypothetical protein
LENIMSDTPPTSPTDPSIPTTAPTPPAPAQPSESTFEHFMSACRHGAALIYHEVVAAESAIANWRSDNPQLSALFDQGVQYVEDLCLAHGIPVMQGVLVVKTIGSALKQMASADPSVPTTVAPAAGATP